jgi:osmotically-inducible protein OsmY
MRKLIVVVGIGAGLTYFFAPDRGARRRAEARDRVLAFFRRQGRGLESVAGSVRADAYGVVQKAKHRQEQPKGELDDATLAQKVESEMFRDAEVPKGQISVNAEDGVVLLRGEVERPELIASLEEKARSVQGVKGVENLLHVTGTEAPMHQSH